MTAPIDISERAQKEIKLILTKKGIPEDYCLRIGVRGAGCGVAFKLGFDHPKEKDEQFEIEGIKVIVQKAEMMFLIGKKIDFYDEADGRGFFFS